MLLPTRHIRGMGCSGCTPGHPQALGGSGTLALLLFPVQTPFLFILGPADRASQATHPPVSFPPTASPEATSGPTRAPAHRPSSGVEPLHQQLLPGFSSNPPHWQIIEPRHCPACSWCYRSHCLSGIAWEGFAIRIASGSSHSEPRGDFAHNKTLYQNQFSPILIFFPLLGQENTASSPQNYPAAMRLCSKSEQDWPSSHCHRCPTLSGEWM